ncbi:hypothetical protein [Bacillus spizizenii]|uniref:hypothetical protein n=1 Tax=Bacillus spizizenii TaxID=96241 RepID=UPI002DBB96F3|nr:hypothetical protein [Bacillus spizizenii]MEC1436624.1 hypothetical protein [Bacillus spizizenii]
MPIQSIAATIEVKTNINGKGDVLNAKKVSDKILDLYNIIPDANKKTHPLNILFGTVR